MSRLKTTSPKFGRYDPTLNSSSDSNSYSDEFDDSDSEQSAPIRQPTHRFNRGYSRRKGYEPMDTLSSTTNSSVLSSPLESTADTTETDPSDLYTPINRRHDRPMIMEEEISPVMGENAIDVPKLRLHREWKPQYTSTTTDIQSLFKKPRQPASQLPPRLPRTNPLTSSTPIRTRIPVLTTYNQVVNMTPTTSNQLGKSLSSSSRPSSYYEVEMDPNRVWDNMRSKSRIDKEDVERHYFRPEEFQIPSAFARNKGISGILFLSMSLAGSKLTVNMEKAFYFSERTQPQQSSYIKLDLLSRHRKRHTSRSGLDEATHSERTPLIRYTNQPEFRKSFEFDLDLNRHQRLFIQIFVFRDLSENKRTKKMLGCMTFPISRILDKVKDSHSTYYKENSSMEGTVMNDEGFFLLDERQGKKTNLPQHKIRRAEYYDDPALSGSCGMTTTSYSSSSNLTNQMPMEEFVTASRQFGSSMIPGTAIDRQMDNSSASSSSSFPHYNHRYHRFTLPNIITTSDSSEQDGFSGVSCQQQEPQDMDHLFADNNMNERKYRRGGSPSPTPNTKHVRRATSFTFSPKDSVDKYNKRPSQTKGEEKKKSGPLSKIFSLVKRSKDSSISTSSLFLAKENCPSKDEVREWEIHLEKLLQHELGCQLFRSFLIKEHSEENLDFWIACEDFKRMKDGEKNTIRRAHEIFENYVNDKALKQVNLDSDTKQATKSALASGARTDTFNLAQNQIELLMRNDTYKRFLKDPLFLDLKLAVAGEQQATEPSV